MNVLVLVIVIALASGRLVLIHDGYEDLKGHDAQGHAVDCCGGEHCFPTETRVGPSGQLQARIRDILGNDRFVDVPDYAILPAEMNPRIGPSICWLKDSEHVQCFWPGRGT